LKAGVSLDQARAEASTIASRLAAAYPEISRGSGIEILQASLIEGRRRNSVTAFFLVLLAVVAVVLIIACANIANLMLVRTIGRQREIAIRQAVGATRFRLIQQFVTEGLLLSLLGGALGVLISLWAGGLLFGFNPLPSFQLQFDLSLDARLLGFSLLVSVLAGVVLGLIPALPGSRIDLVTSLKDGIGTGGGLSGKTRIGNALVVAQVALSLVLLIGAGLLLRSLSNAESADAGFSPDNTFAMDFDLDLKGMSEEQGRRHYGSMIDSIGSLPGVIAVALANRAPLDISTPTTGVSIEGHSPPAGAAGFAVSSYTVDEG
jgi:cell division protein FtsX